MNQLALNNLPALIQCWPLLLVGAALVPLTFPLYYGSKMIIMALVLRREPRGTQMDAQQRLIRPEPSGDVTALSESITQDALEAYTSAPGSMEVQKTGQSRGSAEKCSFNPVWRCPCWYCTHGWTTPIRGWQ